MTADRARVVVAGFEPFESWETNSSELVVRSLRDDPPGGVELEAVVMPVRFGRCFSEVQPALAEPHDAVVGFGLADVNRVRLECLARNRYGQDRPDNAGDLPPEDVILPDGRDFVPATLPLEALSRRLEREDVPVSFSDDAGGYVCNDFFYRLMEHEPECGTPRGFVHLPPVGDRGWPEERLVRAARCVVDELARRL